MPHAVFSVDQAPFRSSFAQALRGDVAPNLLPRQVPGFHYSHVAPTPVRDPHLLAWSEELADFLGLTRPPERGPAVDALAGNLVTPTMQPVAARYGGHQFGSWAGQLGDGRAISLGELLARDGSSWEVQLKGAGPTPYSRRADGRAVLRSSVREFLCSEAMHQLGVPTTRALSLVGTGDEVVRDMFYSGNPQPEPGAIVARVAPSFVRFGSFQLLTATGEIDNLRLLTDYVIRQHYPELGEPSAEVYLRWFAEVCRRTAVLLAHWQAVGFVHGVMNTDNMSILGLTIDYGPYGWLEPYDPDWTPNTTDFGQRRYAFGQQPRVALWNLMMLAQALVPLVSSPNDLTPILNSYAGHYAEAYYGQLQRKLGLMATHSGDAALLQALPPALTQAEADMTLFFRQLAHAAPAVLVAPDAAEETFGALLAATTYTAPGSPAHEALRQWLQQYGQRLQQEAAPPAIIREQMLGCNPKYVLRNYLAQQAIEAAETGDLAPLHTLQHLLRTPYDEHPAHDALAARRPEWASTKPGCATLSCSS